MGPGICDRLVLLSDLTSSFFGAGTIFNLLSVLLEVFGIFGGAILLSMTCSPRAGLLSFFSPFLPFKPSLLPFLDDDFDFELFTSDFLMLPVLAGGGWPSFKLRLESLLSLRADENPLLELVRFDICVLEERSDFSLLNNFNLSNMECLMGGAVPLTTPFGIDVRLPCTE